MRYKSALSPIVQLNRWQARLFGLALSFLLLATLLMTPLNQNDSLVLADNSFGAGLGSGWSGWGHDLLNSRFSLESNDIKPGNLSKLKLKWAFVFPDTQLASSQPTVVGNMLYVGSWN